MSAATRDQIIALQTLYSAWERHTLQANADSRAERLAWASEAVDREIKSFSDLKRDEARHLIDRLKSSMGQQLTPAAAPWRRIRSRDRAHAAGTDGRKGKNSAVIQLASLDDLARIDEAILRLGWTPSQYEAWLNSRCSPRGEGQRAPIRTVAEANKIWWALKAMLRRSGAWHPSPSKRKTQSASLL